jgi:hypothetical protein
MAKVAPDDLGYALESNDDLQNLLRAGVDRWILNGHSHRRMVRHCFLELDFEAETGLVYSFHPDGRLDAQGEAFSLHARPSSPSV